MKTYIYIAVAACALGFISLTLAFSPLGVYALISSIVLGIAALAFTKKHKKKNNMKDLTYIEVAVYVLLVSSLAIFIGGLIYSALNV